MWRGEIDLTPDGGRYYRAIIFHYAFNTVSLTLFLPIICLAYLNPFKFRQKFLKRVEDWAQEVSFFRDFYKYWIYLNCNPDVWHILKDHYIERNS